MNNKVFADSICKSRPRIKTNDFNTLLEIVDDADMAEVIWGFWGEDSLTMLDSTMPAINLSRKWWRFYEPKNTVRLLLKTEDGRRWIWQMLRDASVWL